MARCVYIKSKILYSCYIKFIYKIFFLDSVRTFCVFYRIFINLSLFTCYDEIAEKVLRIHCAVKTNPRPRLLCYINKNIFMFSQYNLYLHYTDMFFFFFASTHDQNRGKRTPSVCYYFYNFFLSCSFRQRLFCFVCFFLFNNNFVFSPFNFVPSIFVFFVL